MKLFNKKFLHYLAFCMAGGLISSLVASVGCCIFFLFFIIPLLPVAFITSWIFGCFWGWISTKNPRKLIISTFIWSVLGFSIISFIILYFWLYYNNVRYSIGFSFLSSIGFAICTFPVIYYMHRKIIYDIFLPPLPNKKLRATSYDAKKDN